MRWVSQASSLVLVALFCGCAKQSPTFDAGKLPGKKANLVLAGANIPVTVSETRSGNHIRWEFVSHGETIEAEEYADGGDSFSAVEVGGEKFDPPIDLLRFPLGDKAQWDWSGNTIYGINRKADAKVVVTRDRFKTAERNISTYRVSVTRSFGPPEKAKAEFLFWFDPESGLIAREFGKKNRRVPVE